jgi:methylthioribose-1-phosphate isomerase
VNIQAVERVDSALRFIDQTKLPVAFVQKTIDDYREIISAIKRLEIRGAPLIGIAASYGIAIASEKGATVTPQFVHRVAEEFRQSRPTAVNLFWAIDRMVRRFDSERTGDFPHDLAILWSEAEAIHREDKEMCAAIGKFGSQLVADGDTILTHCNTGVLATGGIGTALGVIYTAHDEGKRICVYADETRPLLQGARLTAWELQQSGIDVTLICDSAAAMLFKQGKINKVIVGADRIARNGDTANKIGTYSVAVIAKVHGVPFYVAAPDSTFDLSLETGEGIVIEERSPLEVTRGFGAQTAPDGVRVYTPAFDVTPGDLITAFVTNRGVFEPSQISAKNIRHTN